MHGIPCISTTRRDRLKPWFLVLNTKQSSCLPQSRYSRFRRVLWVWKRRYVEKERLLSTYPLFHSFLPPVRKPVKDGRVPRVLEMKQQQQQAAAGGGDDFIIISLSNNGGFSFSVFNIFVIWQFVSKSFQSRTLRKNVFEIISCLKLI